MEIRLNKLISDSGLCSRREADRFIEMGRVTVNGNPPDIGVKVKDTDVVTVDGAVIHANAKAQKEFMRAAPGKAKNLVFGDKARKTTGSAPRTRATAASTGATSATPYRGKSSKPAQGNTVIRDGKEEKYGKYNKYAAARKAAKTTGESGKPQKEGTKKDSPKPKTNSKARTGFNERDILREATKPKFGKSLSKGAVAQRLAAAPKSASLRKSSKNNPVNRAKHAARNKPSEE